MDYEAADRLGADRGATAPRVREVGAVRVVEVSGDLDLYTGPALRDLLYTLADDESVRGVVVDVGTLSFLDSSGLSVLIGGLKRLRSRGASLHLAACRPSVEQIFLITGLNHTFPMHPDVDTAVAAAGADVSV